MSKKLSVQLTDRQADDLEQMAARLKSTPEEAAAFLVEQALRAHRSPTSSSAKPARASERPGRRDNSPLMFLQLDHNIGDLDWQDRTMYVKPAL